MVAKTLGLATGTLVGLAAIWTFNELRDESDADRLANVINDHCLPFVRTGAQPFQGEGRPVGVYDQANLRDQITDGGNRILFDNRFVAQWGESKDIDTTARICIVNDSYVKADSVGFEYDVQTLQGWIESDVLADTDLVATHPEPRSFPTNLVWESPVTAQRFAGLRIVLTVTEGGVSSVLFVNELDQQGD